MRDHEHTLTLALAEAFKHERAAPKCAYFAHVKGEVITISERTFRIMTKRHGWRVLRADAEVCRICPPAEVGKYKPAKSSRVALARWDRF